jgi:hypothetical protein
LVMRVHSSAEVARTRETPRNCAVLLVAC